jgi:protein-L-isoaspartate(D-aspartate) O-methyltransferase
MQKTITRERGAMLLHQVVARGIDDERVLDALGVVPREPFVPRSLVCRVHDDVALAIGGGRWMPRAHAAARALETARLRETSRVLVVGSSYVATLAAEIAGIVYSLEEDLGCTRAAEALVARLGYGNVFCVAGPLASGLECMGPFDAIVVCVTDVALQTLLSQVDVGGRLVRSDGPFGDGLLAWTRTSDEELVRMDLGAPTHAVHAA